jgi:hypothetical protein
MRPLHAVEGGGGCTSVCSHVVEVDPVALLKLGEHDLLADTVQPIACRAPDAALVRWLVHEALHKESGGWCHVFVLENLLVDKGITNSS